MASLIKTLNSRSKPQAQRALFWWGVLRVPAIILVLYFLRQLVAALPVFDGASVTLRVIDIFSVPVSRAILLVGLIAVLAALVAGTSRLKPYTGYGLLMGAVLIVEVLLFEWSGTPLKFAAIPLLLAATNFLPEQVTRHWVTHRNMALAVGVTEGLQVRQHLQWLGRLANAPQSVLPAIQATGWGLAIFLVSASTLFFVEGRKLVSLEQSLRMPDSATVLMRGDINGLAILPGQRRLNVTGHSIQHVLQIDLDDPEAPPATSPVDTGGSQGITFDPGTQELILFNNSTKHLLFVDADTLEERRWVNVSHLADGDPWASIDPISNTIALVSEADADNGVAFLLLDRVTGDVLDTRDIDAGNLLKHPNKPWLYMSFFRRNPEVLVYDMSQREIIKRASIPARVDRMAQIEETNELLVTSPVASEILRLNADTLLEQGVLKAPFGVRTLAFDPKQKILFAGSFTTGQIKMIDMNDNHTIGTVYLGPWLRSIELDTETGTAFVSSNGALYKWVYDRDR
ncbi:YncE family protein [Hyphomonas sp. GM-8P]|uniref:YncE family protein n=1 Tax=Hyphomonas sp. GM-8P TaxID=1280945 RepID=UPI0011BE1B8A|nr:hypothetical protein [Hyphomonas sp. GM-8P]